MTYDKAFFIAKLSAIPDELWCRHYTSNTGPSCVAGHWMESGRVGDELLDLCGLFGGKSLNLVTRINDGYDSRYQQSTPKARILAALNDLP